MTYKRIRIWRSRMASDCTFVRLFPIKFLACQTEICHLFLQCMHTGRLVLEQPGWQHDKLIECEVSVPINKEDTREQSSARDNSRIKDV